MADSRPLPYSLLIEFPSVGSMDSACMLDLLLHELLSLASTESVVIPGLYFLWLSDPAPVLDDPTSLVGSIIVAE